MATEVSLLDRKFNTDTKTLTESLYDKPPYYLLQHKLQGVTNTLACEKVRPTV